jgi:hypothetical protein
MTPKPTLGRTVLFRLADADAPGAPRMHPAVVTRVWSDTCVNLTVFRDGGAIVPAVSVDHAPVDGRPTLTGTWSWPVIQAAATVAAEPAVAAPAAPTPGADAPPPAIITGSGPDAPPPAAPLA